MIPIIILVTLGFSWICFFPLSSSQSNYYLYLLDFLYHYKIISFILIISLLICIKLFIRKHTGLLTFQTLIIGCLASGLFVYFLAFLELNILSLIYKISPQTLGVITNVESIKASLLGYHMAPKIITANKKNKAAIFALGKASVGTENYYGKFILNSFPASLIFTSPDNQPDIILIDDILIISRLDQSEFQTLSPALGYLFIQSYFTQKTIRSFPQVEIISEEKYQDFRRQDFKDKLKLVDDYQKASQDSIATYSAQIADLQKKITENQNEIQNIYDQINKDIKNRQPKYDQVTELNKSLDVYRLNIAETETKLSDAQKLNQYFIYQKSLGEKLIDNIPSERGSFFPPDIIKMTINNSNPHVIADNLQLYIHEYLHYASYAGTDKKLNNPFFEEGLTEFYARKIISNKLGAETNLGYPVLNIIFTKLAKNLPDSDLLEIYFTKNEPALIKLLDRVYGKNFYSQNQGLFIAIQSTNDRQKLLPLANLLMSKIKGEPLTEDDLKSTFSNY